MAANVSLTQLTTLVSSRYCVYFIACFSLASAKTRSIFSFDADRRVLAEIIVILIETTMKRLSIETKQVDSQCDISLKMTESTSLLVSHKLENFSSSVSTDEIFQGNDTKKLLFCTKSVFIHDNFKRPRSLSPGIVSIGLTVELLYVRQVAQDDLHITRDIYPEAAKSLGKPNEKSVAKAVERLAANCWNALKKTTA